MNDFIFVLGIVLSFIFLVLVFGFKVKQHKKKYDDIFNFESEMYKDAESGGKNGFKD